MANLSESQQSLISEFRIDLSNLTNGQFLEIYSVVSKSKQYFVNDLAIVMNCDAADLRNQVFKLKNDLKKLRGELKQFVLDKPFQVVHHKHSAKTAKHSFEPVIKESVVSTMKSVIVDLNETVEEQQKGKSELLERNEILRSERKRLVRNIRCLKNTLQNKRKIYDTLRIKYRTAIAATTKARVVKQSNLKKKVSDLEKNIKLFKKNLSQTESEKKKMDQLNFKQQERIKNLEDERTVSFSEIDKLQETKKDLNSQVSYLESMLVDDLQFGDVIETRDEQQKCYNTATTACVLNLLDEGVGVHHVGKVMTHMSEFCGKKISKLPSVHTINRMADQRARLSYFHMEEKLAEKKDTTLQSDETRKHGECYEVYGVRDDEEKEWVLGLRDMTDKSSQSCLNTLKEILNDISDTTSSEVGHRILANIKNTMSDRAATEKKFHSLLENYRDEILPQVYSNWDELTATEKETLSQMNNFYCGLHILVNFAELCDKVVKKFEENTYENEKLGAECSPETAMFTKKDESGPIRLIRTACKCLARGADEKSGCYLEFRTFLNEKYSKGNKKTTNLLVPFRGNRFNIMFYNAEVVLLLAEDIIEFFSKVHKPSNRLQKSVLFDIKEDKLLAVVKALGLCSKIVTGPFWRALESKDCTLETANEIYNQLHHFLSTAKDDCSDVLCGEDVPFPDIIHQDEIYERLMKTDSYDGLTCAVLQQIFQSWDILLTKAASDHLEGGRFGTVDQALAEQTKSLPKHNKFPERVFALLDALTRFRPAATSLCNEGYIMFSLNKTGEWLKGLPEEKRKEYFEMARTQGKELREQYKQRMKSIETSRREALRKKRQDIEKKEAEQYKQREEIFNDILYYGLWQYTETVDQKLKTISSKTEKKKALKTQIQFRKIVLGQKADKKLFQLSEKGKQYSIETLAENVKTLISSALAVGSRSEDGSIYFGKKIIHYQNENNERKPFPGRVISTVPGYPDWFNVIYDEYPDVYVYKLKEEHDNGDLEIVVELEGTVKQPADQPADQQAAAAAPIPE